MNKKTKSNEVTSTQWLMFALESETYGIDVLHVQEVLRFIEISPVAGAPVTVQGMINIRGKIITVKNMRVILGLDKTDVTEQTRIILMDLGGQSQGILVDSVSGIIDIKSSEIEPIVMGDEKEGVIGTYHKEGKLHTLLSMSEIMLED